MSVDLIRASLLLLALAGFWATAVALVRPVVRVDLPPARRAVESVAPGPVEDSVVARAVRRALDRPFFRADRRAPSAAYDPERPDLPDTPPVPRRARPALAISGIVWGMEPAAVVEGVPGVEGSVVLRRGESAAGLRVVRIDRDRVVIRGMDTTWRLPVREPWK